MHNQVLKKSSFKPVTTSALSTKASSETSLQAKAERSRVKDLTVISRTIAQQEKLASNLQANTISEGDLQGKLANSHLQVKTATLAATDLDQKQSVGSELSRTDTEDKLSTLEKREVDLSQQRQNYSDKPKLLTDLPFIPPGPLIGPAFSRYGILEKLYDHIEQCSSFEKFKKENDSALLSHKDPRKSRNGQKIYFVEQKLGEIDPKNRNKDIDVYEKMDRKRKAIVPATYLYDKNQKPVIDETTASKKPYVYPPQNYPTQYIAFGLKWNFHCNNHNINDTMENFHQYFTNGGEGDVQRTYNDVKSKDNADTFVDGFRHYASFVFGIACSAAGFTIREALCAGGMYNGYKKYRDEFKGKKSPIKADGNCWNNKPNDFHIANGFYSIDRF